MRMLHTSDWHLGRQLHGHDLSDAQAAFIDALVETVRLERVGVVLISGDVHDRALPPVAALQLFEDALVRFRDAGAAVVAISGNHDSAARLGDKSALLDRGISVRTDVADLARPVELRDEHGPVNVYGIPYLEPLLVAGRLPGDGAGDGDADHRADHHADEGPAQARVTTRAMRAVRADLAERGGRSVVLAHGWVAGAAGSDSERDIGVGGIGAVPPSTFDGIDYVALGHLHRPQVLRDGVRYSGSPLAYSFSEADDRKIAWLVDLGADGLSSVVDVAMPVPRPLSTVRATMSELLTSPAFTGQEGHFVRAVATDPVRPQDAVAALRHRFAWILDFGWEPAGLAVSSTSYAARMRGRTDAEVVEDFLAHVRSAADAEELAAVRTALSSVRAAEQVA